MNTKQLQNLLSYLGYDTGVPDGIHGEKTALAVRRFQTDCGLTSDGAAGADTQQALKEAVYRDEFCMEPGPGGFWEEIRNFRRQEFRCRCGGVHCGGFPAEPEERLVRTAQALRDYFDRPVTVTSGVRCQKHNEAVGGVKNSRHLSGKAMDFAVSGVRAELVLEQLRRMGGIRYAYAIGVGHVHMDVE